METLKVIIIDDEPGITSGVSRILRNHSVSYPFMDESFNFKVLEAATGEEGIEIIINEKPDILLLDNKLPGMQGTDILKYLNDNNIKIIVVMITSYASLDIAVKATGFGAYDFIPKPFTPQELKFCVENITKQIYLKRITEKMSNEGKTVRFQFLSILSHELKAPLNALEGYIKMIAEKQFGKDINAYDHIVERSLTRIQGMRHLIMDFLDLSKIQLHSDKKQENYELVDLKKIVDLSLNTMQAYAIQKNVELIFHSKEDVTIQAIPEEMEIIMNNLISNAVKYNKVNGKVEVFLCQTNISIEIQVKDSGIGINQEEIPKMFDEFVRIKNEKTKNILGTGLGLSIVKRLVEQYKGTIDVKSEPDKGSVFTLVFPK